jgi:hypothetical protein
MTDQPAPAEEIRVPIEDKDLQATIAVWLGIRVALDMLDKPPIGDRLAGMELARLLLRREADRRHMGIHQRLTPLLVRAGVDLGAWAAHRFEGFSAVVCVPIVDELEE